ncbi:putative transcription factor C2C2-GATA family [Helianthus annuus]|nr:putative transcription factor C2C2-GATA family [Helianthus annuus]KAJ0472999.1 putative transcription factor C2C2-GATA family [Helianthus annuus]KAJ0648602.1 putative transcription factor C2C2-GATA family [Helianthus annuus]
MEWIEARALKSSFLPEIIGMKSTQQAYIDDFWCVGGINNVVNVSSDEVWVDDLLDLSDKEFSNPDGDSVGESSEEEFASISSSENDSNSMNSGSFSTAGDLVSLTGDQLPVPIDDMESLEWLSQIVDDSVPENPILYPLPAVKLPERADRTAVSRFEPVANVSAPSFTVLGLPYPVPKKCRSGPSRKAGRVWSSGSRSLTESSSSSSSSHDSSITSPMLFLNPVYFTGLFEKPPAAKKQRKSPLGPKTLCNACGVRFKSGRLYPEYRPACSPTFSVDVHSNSHRKVLEMRKRKEIEVEPGHNLAVQTASVQMVEPVLVV